MAQAKKQTLNQSMEQAIKLSVRELVRWCHNTARDQHSKASSSYCVFTRPNREKIKVLVRRVSSLNIENASFGRSQEHFRAFRNAVSDSVKVGILWRCRVGEQRRGGGQDQHPVLRHERYLARTSVAHPVRAQISSPHPSDGCCFTNVTTHMCSGFRGALLALARGSALQVRYAS